MYRYERDRELKKYYNGYDPDSIPNNKIHDKRYVSLLTSMSHTYGNIFAFIQNWIINLFPKDLFKTIHVNSKIAHRQIRSTTHEYVKKTKPIIIFRPRIGDINDEKFYTQSFVEVKSLEQLDLLIDKVDVNGIVPSVSASRRLFIHSHKPRTSL